MGQAPDSVPEYGCWTCGKGTSRDLSARCDHCGAPFDVSSDLLRGRFDQYAPSEYLGRGFYGCTLKVANKIGKEFALKVVPAVLYDQYGKDFTEEVQRYIQVGEHPKIVPLLDASESAVEVNGKPTKVYYLVLPYLKDARNLDEAIESGPVTVGFLVSIARQLSSAIAFLEARLPPMLHNDLHGRNILLQKMESTEFDHAPDVSEVLRVIDFGSAIFKGAGPAKPRDDIQWLGEHLRLINSKLKDQIMQFDPGQRAFVLGLDRIISQALDADPSRRPLAQAVWRHVDELLVKTLYQKKWEPPRLGALASYPNALQFPDESYVASLFSEEFPWLRDLLAADQPLLITGPRGCGKTMILRHADLRTAACRLSEDDVAPQRLKRLQQRSSVGLFVSCRSTFSIHLTTGKTPAWMQEPALAIAFLNLTYLLEAASALLELEEEGLELLRAEEKRALIRLLRELSADLLPNLGIAVDGFSGGLDDLLRWRLGLIAACDRIANGQVLPDAIPELLRTAEPLRRLAAFLSSSVESLRGKRILFLLDDFSEGLIPRGTQQALLPLVFGKFPEYVFWVSAHGMSIPKQDLTGQPYDHNRDYNEINAGWEYNVRASTQLDVCERFLQDIFSKRFQLWGKHVGVPLEELLGRSPYGGALGDHIRALHERKKLRTLRYHGVDIITRLCTGDVSFIVDLVARILAGADDGFPVGPDVQNRRIRAYAREQRQKLRDYYPHGQTLYDISQAFGSMIKHKLVGEPLSSDGRPKEYLRIELDCSRALKPDLEELLRELVCQGVFVNGPGGTSSSEQTTMVLLYRRLFVPAAPASLSDRNTFSWRPETIERFLQDPSNFVRSERAKAGGPSLFDDEEDESDEFE